MVPTTGPYHETREDGAQAWYLDGKLHREDGPAVIYPNGHQEFWVKGRQISPKSSERQ